MINSAEIENFRLFQRVHLSGLSRINMVVGDNGAGKTSLLEALFLGSGATADIATRFRIWRGMETSAQGTPQEVYDGFFLNLFYHYERGRIVSIETKGSDEDNRSLRFYYDTGQPLPLPFDPRSSEQQIVSQTYSPVTFEWTDHSGKKEKSTVQVQGGTIAVLGVATRRYEGTFLGARSPFYSGENAKWFSNLRKAGHESRFLKALREQFPDITDVSLESDLGTFSIHAKQRGSNLRIPIGLISDGMNKFMTILLHIAHASHAVSFVDEIENGIHFSRHERMWQHVFDFASAYETQVFATTHSLECIQAALPVIRKHTKEFALIRTFRRKDHAGDVTVVSGKEAVDLISSGLEVRK